MKQNLKLLFFGADWCPHCRDFKKTFKKLKEFFKADDIEFWHVDLMNPKMKKWGDKFEVGGIPDIRIFHEGELGQYADKRDFKTIKTVLKKLLN
tara:strand:+ start:811 stop:1092 length:282 start_codon:yes stop_codon:yes gene_type:complete